MVNIIILKLIISFLYFLRTSPTLNILLYNAIGGSGDELYGIEPIGYYVKNLIINMSLSWILIILSPIFIVTKLIISGRHSFLNGNVDSILSFITIVASSFIWIIVLFSRPHKVNLFFLNFIIIMF